MTNLTHALDAIIADHGHAQPLLKLAAMVACQARWEPRARAQQINEAVELLSKAAAIISRLEAERAAAS